MSYIEIKAIKAVAALHRGVVNLAIHCLELRKKLALKKYARQSRYAAKLLTLSTQTRRAGQYAAYEASKNLNATTCAIASAEHTVLNLRDDLAKIQ